MYLGCKSRVCRGLETVSKVMVTDWHPFTGLVAIQGHLRTVLAQVAVA